MFGYMAVKYGKHAYNYVKQAFEKKQPIQKDKDKTAAAQVKTA